MVVTEEEAVRLQCPHTTYCINELQVSQYNAAPLMAIAQCCASSCMAWRVHSSQWKMPDGDIYYHPKEGATRIDFGYCGLAGRVKE